MFLYVDPNLSKFYIPTRFNKPHRQAMPNPSCVDPQSSSYGEKNPNPLDLIVSILRAYQRRKKLVLPDPDFLGVDTIFTCFAMTFLEASDLVITSIFPVDRTMTKTKPGYRWGFFEISLTDGWEDLSGTLTLRGRSTFTFRGGLTLQFRGRMTLTLTLIRGGTTFRFRGGTAFMFWWETDIKFPGATAPYMFTGGTG